MLALTRFRREWNFSPQIRTDIIRDLDTKFRQDHIVFDCLPNGLPFQNGILNLETGQFRRPCRTDYISMYIPYAFEPMDNEAIENSEVMMMLKRIWVNSEKLNHALLCACTSLFGKCIQHCFVMTGSGGNGKGVFQRLMKAALTDVFAMEGNSAILSQGIKPGSNPEVARMGNKRLVIFKEPDDTKGISNVTLKQLTGGDSITARTLYDTQCEHQNHMTMFIETNRIPKMKTLPGEAEARRLIMIPCTSMFRSVYEKDDWEKQCFPAIDKYNDERWILEHRNDLINILLPFAMTFARTNTIPPLQSGKLESYFASCDPITEFVHQHTEPEDQGILYLRMLHDEFLKQV